MPAGGLDARAAGVSSPCALAQAHPL